MTYTPQGYSPNTESIVNGIGSGDPEASTALHNAFASRIRIVAQRSLRSRADAEDVCNETLMRVVRALRNGKLETPCALPGFVLGTARNVIREMQRGQLRVEQIGDRDFAASEATVIDHTIHRAIAAVMNQLKPRERDFVRLYFFEELPKAEISQRLGIHNDRVRLVKSRALKSFREAYECLTHCPAAR